MSLMTEALERISQCHLTRPKRTREEVERQLRFFPFELSEEVYEYYQWAGAPIGNQRPPGWDGSYNDNSTYSCVLEHLLDGASDLIHFMSLEEAEEFYPNYSLNADLYDAKCLPFTSYENGVLVIAGSENQIDVSPVLQRESGRDKLWFPSLTNMMLSIAECVEAIGTILPMSSHVGGERLEEEEICERWNMIQTIARKYGSPTGMIVTN
jgi:hypothetical protein